MTKDITTENKILEAAKQTFTLYGMRGARMQQIADLAGINKALLHYYFRSKEQLFEKVFMDAFQVYLPTMASSLQMDAPLRDRIEIFVSRYIEMLLANPFIPLFIITEVTQDPERLLGKIGGTLQQVAKGFEKALQSEIDAGTIRPIPPMEVVISIMSLCAFPFVARPVLQPTFGVTDDAYRHFQERRKQEVPQIIWSYLTDNNTSNP